jgi:hypothetical protein
LRTALTGKKYIGKKLFHMMKTRQVKKKKKRYKAESDWESYFGSNEELQNDAKTTPTVYFNKTILYLCKSKSECSYYETKEQFARDVLIDDTYYNHWITCKITAKHLDKLKHRISADLV